MLATPARRVGWDKLVWESVINARCFLSPQLRSVYANRIWWSDSQVKNLHSLCIILSACISPVVTDSCVFQLALVINTNKSRRRALQIRSAFQKMDGAAALIVILSTLAGKWSILFCLIPGWVLDYYCCWFFWGGEVGTFMTWYKPAKSEMFNFRLFFCHFTLFASINKVANFTAKCCLLFK